MTTTEQIRFVKSEIKRLSHIQHLMKKNKSINHRCFNKDGNIKINSGKITFLHFIDESLRKSLLNLIAVCGHILELQCI